jgi:rubredoxin
MLISTAFAVLLIVVVAAFYLLPKRQHCPGCGAKRNPESPLCTECGWIHDEPEVPGDNEADEEDEMVDDPRLEP